MFAILKTSVKNWLALSALFFPMLPSFLMLNRFVASCPAAGFKKKIWSFVGFSFIFWPILFKWDGRFLQKSGKCDRLGVAKSKNWQYNWVYIFKISTKVGPLSTTFWESLPHEKPVTSWLFRVSDVQQYRDTPKTASQVLKRQQSPRSLGFPTCR